MLGFSDFFCEFCLPILYKREGFRWGNFLLVPPVCPGLGGSLGTCSMWLLLYKIGDEQTGSLGGLGRLGEVLPELEELSFSLENSICEISWWLVSAANAGRQVEVWLKPQEAGIDVIVHPRVNLHNWATNLEMGEDPTRIFHWLSTHSNTCNSDTVSIADVIFPTRSVSTPPGWRQWQACKLLPNE